MEHVLKILPEYFDAIVSGRKTFEVRKEDDKKFEEGDTLFLLAYNDGEYAGRTTKVKVTYCLREPYAKEGHVIMAIRKLKGGGSDG